MLEPNSGIFLRLISFESILWWALYGFVLRAIYATRRHGLLQDATFICSISYILLVIGSAALIEVNVGTAFRHKSLLLIPILIIIRRCDYLQNISKNIKTFAN